MALVKGLAATGEALAASAATLVEAINPAMNPAAVRWAVSGIEVVPVSRTVAFQAADLLRAARRHGHRDAMDAMVCATAVLAGDARVTVLTSDPDDIGALLGANPQVTVLALSG
jgi:predicted nucleic acid-binding protein